LRDFGRLCLGVIPFWLVVTSAFAAPAPPPPSVGVTPVITQNIAPSFSNIGHVVAIQSVKIVARVTAYIDVVNFQQGSAVKAGQLLFSLQPEQYQAALLMAQAQLASAQAAVANAQLVVDRATALRATGFEAQSMLDANNATRSEDQANVLAAQAAVATAKLNLSYCTITAPIDGRIGAVALTEGNLVSSSTGTLATINQLNPIRVEFSVSADSPILTAFQSDPSEQQFDISIDLPNGQPYPIKGKIAFLDNQVDTNTGTVNVYADFGNPKGALLPGAYVNVQTAPSTPQEVAMVPVAAVQADPKGSFVLVLEAGNKVVETNVTLGDQIDQNFIVKSGISPGQQVVIDGIQKVKNGEVVSPTVETAAQ
jgi:membrane fusion protein (multidrug efflux system)